MPNMNLTTFFRSLRWNGSLRGANICLTWGAPSPNGFHPENMGVTYLRSSSRLLHLNGTRTRPKLKLGTNNKKKTNLKSAENNINALLRTYTLFRINRFGEILFFYLLVTDPIVKGGQLSADINR